MARPAPATAAEQLTAIGSTAALPATLRRAFDPVDHFAPLGRPKQGGWLATHRERPQTFDEFTRAARHSPDARRRTIHLLPLGSFPEERSSSLDRLLHYASRFFMLPVEVLPEARLDESAFSTRRHPQSRHRQVLTSDILDYLFRRIPEDSFGLLGVTMEDLYPGPGWDFVFGEASSRGRVGVCSFARYDPAFYGERRGAGYPDVLLRRCLKVMTHEIGHLFGMAHCVHFRCLMNGSNHLAESDARPLGPCPVCLRKLHHAIGFDVAARYRGLLELHRTAGFHDDARWIERRLRFLESG
jgi:archaemetzincin